VSPRRACSKPPVTAGRIMTRAVPTACLLILAERSPMIRYLERHQGTCPNWRRRFYPFELIRASTLT
jgi:hypothetical protein